MHSFSPPVSHIPAKRSRVTKTRDQRISYLRSDPHVKEFEASRVLCGLCTRWIKLRTTYSYCAIPWEKHRRTCLAQARKSGATGGGTKKTGAGRTRPVLSDLDSVDGRRDFVYISISHLFTTTFDVTDHMSVSTLLSYLNSAMPPDKHAEFDTPEVVRAVSCLKDKGSLPVYIWKIAPWEINCAWY